MGWSDTQVHGDPFNQPFDDASMSDVSPEFYFTDTRIEHLRFIQAIVRRMARNSFMLKGWSISIVSIVIAILADNMLQREAAKLQIDFAILAIPVLCFWGLDAYYLCQEQLFRKLYEVASQPRSSLPLLSLDPHEARKRLDPSKPWPTWLRCFFTNPTIVAIHGPLLAVVLWLDFANGGYVAEALARV